MSIDWRKRLREALEQSGKTMRAASIEADCGPGYLHDILNTEREPSIERLARIARVLGVSLIWLWHGYNIGPSDERLLARMAQLSENKRKAVLQLISDDE